MEINKHITITAWLLAVALGLALFCLPGCQAKSSNSYTENERSDFEAQNQSKAPGSAAMDQAQNSNDMDVQYERKIIQSAHLTLKVEDVLVAADRIIKLNSSNGGYTVNSHTYRHAERVSAELILKVPQQNLNNFLETISSYGEMNDKTINTEDVTEEYYDAEARLTVLKAKEERLINLFDQADNITDIISIENELGATRSEIEVLAGRLNYLSNATDYSLVNINLTQAIPGTVKAPQGTVGKSVQGLINSLNQLVNFASSLIVFIFILLPWLVILAVFYLLSRYVIKRRKSRATKE